MIEVTSLKDAEYNPRGCTKDEYQQIMFSIYKFGIVEPIVVNSNKERFNVIIGGHRRLDVCKDLGYDKVPVVYVDKTIEEEKELNIRLNKNTGHFDMDLLANHFDPLQCIEWGFTPEEIFGQEPEEQSVIEKVKKIVITPTDRKEQEEIEKLLEENNILFKLK
jgi:ParB-like chromosome segregation protein Spo0J